MKDIEQLLARQDYSGASKLLQSMDCSQLAKDDLITYLISKTHALIYQGDYDTSHIDISLELLRGCGISKTLAKARLLKGLALDKQGNYADAQQHYLEASVSYRNLDDPEFAAVAVNLLGQTHLRMGDFEAAQKTFGQALEMMRSLRSKIDNETLRRKERDIAHNLANTKIQFGRLRLGLQDYDAYPISRNEIDSDSGRNYFLNRAKAFALCKQTSDCRNSLEMCLPFLEGRSREQSLYWQCMALSHYIECEFAKALECLNKAQADIKDSKSDLLPGILRRKAECYWQLDERDKTYECVNLAFASAMVSRERVERAVSYRLLALVANVNVEEQARQLFQQSLDLLEEIDSQYELAQAQKSAACSGLYSVAESTRLLNQSNSYFDREQIPRLSNKHVEEILAHIAIHQSNPSQRKRIIDILDSKNSC